MENFSTVMNEMESKFPVFVIEEDMIDLPTVISGAFCNYLIAKLAKDDEEIINRLVAFVNKLSKNLDPKRTSKSFCCNYLIRQISFVLLTSRLAVPIAIGKTAAASTYRDNRKCLS